MKLPHLISIRSIPAVLLFFCTVAFATDNHEYGANEYVTISNGISPDGRLAITAHGEGDMGYDNFHLYLFDANSGKKIGPLEEIAEVLDTGAGSYAAKWAKDGSEVTIVYRVDRHAPLKSMSYHLAKRRAVPATRSPADVQDEALIKFWQDNCADSKPSRRIFGTPKPGE